MLTGELEPFLNWQRRFSKTFQNLSAGQMNISRHFPKIIKNNQRLQKMTNEYMYLKMFQSHTNKLKHSLTETKKNCYQKIS